MSETEMTSFADVLKSKNAPPPPPAEEATAEVEIPDTTTPPPAKPAEVVETPEVETDTETDAAAAVDPVKQAAGYKRAMLEERKKRQHAEELLTRQISQAQPPPKVAPPAAPIGYYDDPEKFVQQTVSETQDTVTRAKADMSEIIARQRYADYDEKLAAYEQIATANPHLHQQILASQNPAEAAYREGKRILFEKEYGTDEESILKNAEAKVRAKVEAEVEQRLLGKVAKKVNQPTNILGARAAGGDAAPEFRPTGWSDVVRAKRKR